MPVRAGPFKEAQILHYYQQSPRPTDAEIGRIVGVHRATVARIVRKHAARNLGVPGKVAESKKGTHEWFAEHPPPKPFSELSSLAQDALLDLPLFCDQILGEPLHSHQVAWHRELIPYPFAMLNAHPRSGKSDLLTKRALWRLAGGGHPESYYTDSAPLRDAQVMLVSHSEGQANKNASYLSVRLEDHHRLISEYGRFREYNLPWQESRGAFVIAGRRRLTLSGDFSLVCVGVMSSVLGRGGTDIFIDDAFDIQTIKSPEQAERALLWMRTQVFSRLEPGGVIVILGARLPYENDPYTEISEWPADYEGDWEEEPTDEAVSEDERLFHTVVHPAVLDWDNRMVLCPDRFTWPQLMAARSLAGHDVWSACWMQDPMAAARDSLAKREWIYGDEDHRGCLDGDRLLGQPPDIPGRRVRFCSVDPSDQKYWGCLVADLEIPARGNRPRQFTALGYQEYRPHLIDISRHRHSTGSALKLLQDWHGRYAYEVLVVERNIARFLVENDRYTSFLARSGARVVYHYTSAENKLDRLLGMGSLAYEFEHGRIRVPWGDLPTRVAFEPFVKEALGKLRTDDLMMSIWFPKWQLGTLSMIGKVARITMGMPPHAPIGPPPRLEGVAL